MEHFHFCGARVDDYRKHFNFLEPVWTITETAETCGGRLSFSGARVNKGKKQILEHFRFPVLEHLYFHRVVYSFWYEYFFTTWGYIFKCASLSIYKLLNCTAVVPHDGKC